MLCETKLMELIEKKADDLELYRDKVGSLSAYARLEKKVVQKKQLTNTFNSDTVLSTAKKGKVYSVSHALQASKLISDERATRTQEEIFGQQYVPSKNKVILRPATPTMTFSEQKQFLEDDYIDNIRHYSPINYDEVARTLNQQCTKLSDLFDYLKLSYQTIREINTHFADNISMVKDAALKEIVRTYLVKKKCTFITILPTKEPHTSRSRLCICGSTKIFLWRIILSLRMMTTTKKQDELGAPVPYDHQGLRNIMEDRLYEG
jgi:hypothetical protein